jgi:cell division protein ZapA
MNHDKNEVRVQIFGTTYTIRGEADPEHIQRVAATVDAKMREINEKLPVASVAKVAVLASLNLADELSRERERRRHTAAEVDERAKRLIVALDQVLQTA